MGRHATPLAVRFWANVDATGDCWHWTGYRGANGYGRINVAGRTVYAHRAAYELAHGAIPDGLQVLHRCDTPACVRPEHLFVGDWLANARDRAQKGRWPAKLTATDVREIRRLHAEGGRTLATLAAQFGVGISAIHRVIHRDGWRHVP
jgi:hypothetical protein